MAVSPRRLAVLRVWHTDVPSLTDRTYHEFFMANPDRSAVFEYWEQETNGHLALGGSEIFGPVRIPFGADVPLGPGPGPERSYVLQAAVAATPGFDENAFDGVVVVVSDGWRPMPNPQASEPGQPATIRVGVNAGAWPVGRLTGAVLVPRVLVPPDPRTPTHTFACHEVGHVLGFGHTFGLPNGADPVTGTYGDPYDIMSAENFADSGPTTTIPGVAGWPVAGAAAEPLPAGPGLTRAMLHYSLPDAMVGRTEHRAAPGHGQDVRALLHASSAEQGPTLLVVDGPGEPADPTGRVYVEYRIPAGWDRGLDVAGADRARRAVIVHAVAEPRGRQCVYRGRILMPLEADSDLQVVDTGLVVRAVEPDDVDDPDVVEIVVGRSADRSVRLTPGATPDAPVVVQEEAKDTDCGRLRSGVYLVPSTVRATTTGYGGIGEPVADVPLLRWTVAGVPVPAGSITVSVSAAGGTVPVTCTLDPSGSRLTLTGPLGGGVDVDVSCTATEADGSEPRAATVRVPAGTRYEGMRWADTPQYLRCLARNAEVPTPERDELDRLASLIDRGVQDPFDGEMLVDRMRVQEILQRFEVTDGVRALADEAFGPVDAARVTPAVEARLGAVAADDLRAQILAFGG